MPDEYDSFDEYGDLDAISCANGDYNAWEEQQCFLDREYDDYRDDDEGREYDSRDYDYEYDSDF